MPVAIVDDWGKVRDLAASLGSIKDACVQLGVNYDAARQRAKRDNWPVGRRLDKLVTSAQTEKTRQIVAKNGQNAVVTSVTSTADHLASRVVTNCTKAREFLSRAAVKGAKAFANLPGEALTDARKSQAFRNVTGATAQIGGWDEGKDQGAKVMVNIGLLMS